MQELNDKNFDEEVIESKAPVLVDFFAIWCGPCQTATSVLEELEKEHEGKVKFGKVNVDESGPLAQKYGVMSIPTVVIFKAGKEVKREVGFLGEKGYKKIIEEII